MRRLGASRKLRGSHGFPFLFGGTFIEAKSSPWHEHEVAIFPFLFGGTFIEASNRFDPRVERQHFPSFSEGLSLRRLKTSPGIRATNISLPFRRDFH